MPSSTGLATTPSTCSNPELDGDTHFDVSLLGLAIMPSMDDTPTSHAPRTLKNHPALAHLQLAKFLGMFKATNKIKSLHVDSFGTFDLPPGMELQFTGQYQPIPHGLRCTFTMFLEQWESSIDYVLVDDGKDTALQFSIRNVRTGKTTSLVETREERHKRRVSKRVLLICNKAFDLAWRLLENKQHLGPRGTNESATLFGLKSCGMRDFVCAWYADEEIK